MTPCSYEAQTVDIHDQGRYLVEKKYKHLRAAYIFLGLALIAGAVVQGIATGGLTRQPGGVVDGLPDPGEGAAAADVADAVEVGVVGSRRYAVSTRPRP